MALSVHCSLHRALCCSMGNVCGYEGIPVLCDKSFEPKEVLMVVVKDTALRWESTTERWLVP